MSGIGAELPPHLLAKRKRQQEEEAKDAENTSPGAKPTAGAEEPDKRRKVIGPAMPPAPLDERPESSLNAPVNDSSDGDDDFGPALPSGIAIMQALNEDGEDGIQTGGNANTHADEKLKRDDWMMMPPKQDDLAARLDPTKQRPTKFSTGKGARGHSSLNGDTSTWHETPEQKQKRLQDEMMGISKPLPVPNASAGKISKVANADAASHAIKEKVETTRGPSLLERHQKSKGAEAEDDPSKRAFDREKDMASSSRISSTQKREMLNKASDFSGKFSGGTFL